MYMCIMESWLGPEYVMSSYKSIRKMIMNTVGQQDSVSALPVNRKYKLKQSQSVTHPCDRNWKP